MQQLFNIALAILIRADLRGDFYLDFDDEDDIKKAQEDALRIIQHLTISLTIESLQI